jgi:hypothetical protein
MIILKYAIHIFLEPSHISVVTAYSGIAVRIVFASHFKSFIVLHV